MGGEGTNLCACCTKNFFFCAIERNLAFRDYEICASFLHFRSWQTIRGYGIIGRRYKSVSAPPNQNVKSFFIKKCTKKIGKILCILPIDFYFFIFLFFLTAATLGGCSSLRFFSSHLSIYAKYSLLLILQPPYLFS